MTPDFVDPKLLQLLLMLNELGSVTRVAEKFGQSQSTVSIWLKQLRTAFNDPLFVRSGDGLRPTPRALELIEPARAILVDLARLRQLSSFDPVTSDRRFALSMTDASHMTLLPEIFSCLRVLAPNITLRAMAIDDYLAKALERGVSDIAIGHIPSLDAGIYRQKLFEQDWVCLASDLSAFAKNPTIETYDRSLHAHVEGGTAQKMLAEALLTAGLTRSIGLTLPGFLGLGSVISQTELVATVPRHTGETLAATNRIQVFPIPFPITGFTVYQYWHERFDTDSTHLWLRRNLSELFANK